MPASRSTHGSAGKKANVLPVPLMNVVNGGAHAQNSLDLQEFMVVPAGAESFSAGAARSVPRSSTRSRRSCTSAGWRLAWATRAASRPTSGRARRRSRRSSRRPSGRVIATGWRSRSIRRQRRSSRTASTRSKGVRCLRPDSSSTGRALSERFPIVSIEDPLAEDEWSDWRALTERLGERVQLIGDDLFVTNIERLRRGIDAGRGERDPHQGEPDRHAHGDTRGDRACPLRRVCRRHLAPVGRDRGHDDRRPRRRHRSRTDQGRRPFAAPTGWRSTTSSCGSRRSSASGRPIRAGKPFLAFGARRDLSARSARLTRVVRRYAR